MAYDPQAGRRRPRPADSEPAPVEALLGAAPDDSTAPGPTDDPPPIPAVTPHPADPPSDTLLLKTTVLTVVAALVTLLLARQLWRRTRRTHGIIPED